MSAPITPAFWLSGGRKRSWRKARPVRAITLTTVFAKRWTGLKRRKHCGRRETMTLCCAGTRARASSRRTGWLPAKKKTSNRRSNSVSLNAAANVSRDPDSVRAMFGRIARRYDLANHLLSGGADFLWRRRAAKIVTGWRPRDVLDLATGSGDLALAVQRHSPEAKITAADFSPEMLEVAHRTGVVKTVLVDP